VLSPEEIETALVELEDLKYNVAYSARTTLEWEEVSPEEKFGEI
jgi:hypothetical protein